MPTPDTPALGVSARLAVGAAAPTDKGLDFESETLGVREVFLDAQGLRGTRSHAANRVRPTSRMVTGNVVLGAPTAVELSYILPYITGGTPASSGTGFNYPLAEALGAFFVDLLRGATLFRYSGCRVARAEFSARKGTALRLSLDILGVDETRPGGAFPSAPLDGTTTFFVHEDAAAAITINGSTIETFEWMLTIDNAVQARQVNSQTATVVYSTDRVVTWRSVHPWGDDEALYNLAFGGVACSATFTVGNTSFSATCPKVSLPRQSPDVAGRDELKNIIEGVARFGTNPGDEVALFLDSTP